MVFLRLLCETSVEPGLRLDKTAKDPAQRQHKSLQTVVPHAVAQWLLVLGSGPL